MFFKNLCLLVLWTKVASALEGLILALPLDRGVYRRSSVRIFHTCCRCVQYYSYRRPAPPRYYPTYTSVRKRSLRLRLHSPGTCKAYSQLKMTKIYFNIKPHSVFSRISAPPYFSQKLGDQQAPKIVSLC